MSINSTSAVNFSATTNQINNSKKELPKPIQNIKNKYDNLDDGKKKLCKSLITLGSIAIAGLGIAAAIKHGKSNVINETISNKAANATAEVASSVGEEVKAADKVVKEVVTPKATSEIIQEANEKILSGENYSTTRKTVTKNLDKESKKEVKKAISQTRAQLIENENQAVKASKENMKSIKNSNGEIKNLNQGIKVHEYNQNILKSHRITEEAQQKAAVQKEIYEQNPTHKNKILAKRAENEAIDVELKAKKVRENSYLKREENKKERLRKSNLPPVTKEQKAKMEANKTKTQENSIKRKAKKEVSHPAYQRYLKKYQGYSEEKLTKILTNEKSSTFERKVAQDLLQKA